MSREEIRVLPSSVVDEISFSLKELAGLQQLQNGRRALMSGSDVEAFAAKSPVILMRTSKIGRLALVGLAVVSNGIVEGAVLVIPDNDHTWVEDVDIEPRRLGIWPSSSNLISVAVAGGYAYVTSTEALEVLDVSDPASPRLAGRAVSSGGGDVAIQCGYAYVVGFSRLEVFDVSNSLRPVRVGQYEEVHPRPLCTDYTAVTVEGDYAYVTANWYCDPGGLSGSGMVIFDISNPADPHPLSTYLHSWNTGAGTWDVVVSGNYAYLASAYPNLTVVDISDPTNPQWVSYWDDMLVGFVYGLTSSGKFLYLTDPRVGLSVVDVSRPCIPQRIGDPIEVQVGHLSWPSGPWMEGNRLCVAGSDALEFFDVREPSCPRREAIYATAFGPVALSGSRAYVANRNGLEVVDLSVAANPQRAGTFDPREPLKDLVASTDRAYLVQQETWDGVQWHGCVRVIDTLDPAHPREVGSLNVSNLVAAVAVSGDYLYLAEVVVTNETAVDGSLRVIDFSSPANPRQVGEYKMSSRAYSLALCGRYAYLLEADRWRDGGGGLTILDISDPSHPQRIGGNDDAVRATRFIVSGNHSYAVTNCPTGGLVVTDVSDPVNPKRVGGYSAAGVIGGIEVAGDYAYLAEQGEWHGPGFVGGGLTVLFLGEPAHPQSLGTFTTGGTARDVALSSH